MRRCALLSMVQSSDPLFAFPAIIGLEVFLPCIAEQGAVLKARLINGYCSNIGPHRPRLHAFMSSISVDVCCEWFFVHLDIRPAPSRSVNIVEEIKLRV